MAYLLDTDSASLAFRGNVPIRARIRQAPSPGVWLSAIAAEEIMQGTLGEINKHRDKAGSLAAYQLFLNAIESICEYRVHPYNTEAILVYASFPASVSRVGTQDCRIAASAIAAGWVVVSKASGFSGNAEALCCQVFAKSRRYSQYPAEGLAAARPPNQSQKPSGACGVALNITSAAPASASTTANSGKIIGFTVLHRRKQWFQRLHRPGLPNF